MNLFTADIRGLTLDLQAPAELASSPPSQPPGRPGGDLDTISAGRLQAIEFNVFFDRLSTAQAVSDEALNGAPGDAWRDYLAHAPIQVTTDSEPALMRPAAVAPAARVLSAMTPPGLLPTPPFPGESLPPGGNALPRPALPAALTAAVVPPPASGTPVSASPLPAEPPAGAGQSTAAAGAPRSMTSAELQVGSRGERPTTGAAGVATPAQAVEPLSAGQTGRDGASRFAAGVGVRSQSPAAAPAAATPGPQALPPLAMSSAAAPATAVSPLESAVAPGGELRAASLAEAVAAAALTPAREGRAAALAETPPPRGQMPAIEAATTAGSRPPAPAAVSGPEMLTTDGLPARGAETPVPASTLTASVAAAAPAPPATSPAVLPPSLESLGLSRQAGASDWGNGLGERVSWMIDQRQNSATIRLDPPTLGKLEVQVRIADDATTISIQAQHAPTRELIEASATRLRDFLHESGFQNVNVDVSQRQDQQQARAQTAAASADGADEKPAEPDHPAASIADRGAAGDGAYRVDTFV